MSLQQKTTAELSAIIVAQLETAFSETLQLLPRSFSRVISKVLGGIFVLLYKYGGFIFLQHFVQYASIKPTTINGQTVTPLVEWGRLTGAEEPLAATRFEGTVSVAVSTPDTIPRHTQLVRLETGVTYLTLADAISAGGVATPTVRAVSDQDGNGGQGVLGNLDIGDSLSFVNPRPSVQGDAITASVTTTAANAEDWNVYRQRVIDRFRSQPQGGAAIDYEIWGEGTEGIINTYPYTGDPGQTDLYSEATELSSGSADGIPTAAQLLAVKDNVELNSSGLATRRPINSYVNSYAITRLGFDLVVSGLDVDDEAGCQADIILAATQYFWSRAPYIPGVTLGIRADRISQSAVIGAVQDVVNAYSGVFSTVALSFSGGLPVAVYSLGKGEKSKVVDVTFV